MYPFERFSDSAKRLLMLAQEEAESAQHSYIGTEHLLLAMLRAETGLAPQVLAALGVDEAKVRPAIDSVLGRDERIIVKQIIPTSRVKKVIEIAFDESRRGQRKDVTTGDLLLALVVEGHGIAAHVLKDLGVREVDVRAELGRLNVAGVREGGDGGARLHRRGAMVSESQPVGQGSRVLVHDSEPPHRLWEGRVVAVDQGVFVVEVPDRPGGDRVTVEMGLLHPVPTGPTFMCQYCRSHL
jgi:ATP-dependent Clp protease ATP-binding subunit ClpA